MDPHHIELTFNFHLGGLPRAASARVEVEEMDSQVPLVKIGTEGRMASYAAWVVYRGRMWRPAMPGDMSVSLHGANRYEFTSLSDVTRSIASHRHQRSGDFALNAGSPMVADESVTPGWVFYSSGSSRMVFPALQDNDSEPSGVATFVPASRGTEEVRKMTEEFGVSWGPEHDVFVDSAIEGLGDAAGASPVITLSPSWGELESALSAYFLNPSPAAARAVHDALDDHQRYVTSSASRLMLR